jgi:hypothetical protein
MSYFQYNRTGSILEIRDSCKSLYTLKLPFMAFVHICDLMKKLYYIKTMLLRFFHLKIKRRELNINEGMTWIASI